MTRHLAAGMRTPVSARVLTLLPPVVVMALVAVWGVDVPYWDTWDWLDRHYLVPTNPYEAPSATAMLPRYWALFNDHRVFVPLLVDRAVLSATGGDMLLRAWLKVPLSLGVLWLALRLARRAFAHGMPAWLGPALACLAFPLTYWPMWMDPRQFSVHIVLLATLGALAAASAPWRPARRLAVTAACCVVASLSYTHGLFAWPAVAVVLLVSRPRPPVAGLLVWGACGLLLGALHVADMRATPTHVAETAAPDAVGMAVAMLAVIGVPVAPSLSVVAYVPTIAAGAGAVFGLVWLAFLVMRSHDVVRHQAVPWLMLAAWGLVTAAAIGWSRGGLPLGALHDPRFAVTSAVVWMAGLVVLARVTQGVPDSPTPPSSSRDALPRRAPDASHGRLVLTLVAVLAITYTGASLRPLFAAGGLGGFPSRLASGRACLQALEDASDACLAQLYPSPARVRELAARLGPERLRVLREAPSKTDGAESDEGDAVQQR